MLCFEADVRATIDLPTAGEVQIRLIRAMRRATQAVQRRARVNASGRFFRVRSGRTLKSIRASVRTDGLDVVGRVGTRHFVGRLLETGFPAQELVATRGSGFFAVRSGGRILRLKRIHHPGLRPRPWFSTAVAESQDDIVQAFEAEISAAAARQQMPTAAEAAGGDSGRSRS